MKKILIILLMILSISLVACSDKYEKIYNLDNEIEIVEVLSEEEVKAYFEECRRVLETIDYITYEGTYYDKSNYVDSDGDSIKEYKEIRKGKFQRNSEIQFMFEYYKAKITEKDETKVVSDYKTYGKDGKLYQDNSYGERFYTCRQYRVTNPMGYFGNNKFFAGSFNMGYSSGFTYGIDERGNLICQKNYKWIDDLDSISIYVYSDYKLLYAEWRMLRDDQIVYLYKDTFSYNWFMPVVENFDDYEHSSYCMSSDHDMK